MAAVQEEMSEAKRPKQLENLPQSREKQGERQLLTWLPAASADCIASSVTVAELVFFALLILFLLGDR